MTSIINSYEHGHLSRALSPQRFVPPMVRSVWAGHPRWLVTLLVWCMFWVGGNGKAWIGVEPDRPIATLWEPDNKETRAP